MLADRITSDRYAQGESPRWTGGYEVAWTDMTASTLYVGEFVGGSLIPRDAISVGERIGSAARVAGSDAWLVGADRSFYLVDNDGAAKVVAELPSGHGFMNDGVCDSGGRFWSGTQAVPREPVAALYSLEPDGTVVERLSDVTVSNGICTSLDSRTLYYIDTLPHRSLEAFDIAPDGSLSGRRTIARIQGGNPDGMTIDEEGCLWIAVWDAGEVVRIDPFGRICSRVRVPARRPTAVALVADVLVITTASIGMEADPLDMGGYVFAAAAPAAGRQAPAWGSGERVCTRSA